MPITRTYSTHARALVAATVLLCVLAFLPARFGRWANQLQTIPSLVFAPVQGVVYWMAASATRDDAGAPDERVHAIAIDRDQWMSIARRLQVENTELRARLSVYETGAMTPDPRLRFARASVIGPTGGPGSQILRIRAGSSDGVTQGTVAVVDNVQVVGRVEQVGVGSSTLVLITQQDAPDRKGSGTQIGGAIFPGGNTTAEPLACLLVAPGDGTLQGLLEHRTPREGEAPATASVGQTVYLDDSSWPANSRMLVLGTIEEVRPFRDSPLRSLIIVRPTARLDRLTEVTLRIPTEDEPPAAGAAKGGRGP